MDEDAAIDAIYSAVDAWLRAGLFMTVDLALDDVPMALSVVELLAYASITSAAKDKLSNRDRYMKRLRAHLEQVRPDDVEELLRGLE